MRMFQLVDRCWSVVVVVAHQVFGDGTLAIKGNKVVGLLHLSLNPLSCGNGHFHMAVVREYQQSCPLPRWSSLQHSVHTITVKM